MIEPARVPGSRAWVGRVSTLERQEDAAEQGLEAKKKMEKTCSSSTAQLQTRVGDA